MLSRTLAPIALLFATATATANIGCAGTVSSEPPASADTATTRAPVAVSAHGPVKFFGEALGDVPLTATQRTAIEQLASDAESRHAQVRAAGKDLMMTLAAQVDAGALDRAALKPKLDALSTALQSVQPADRAAFEQLHAVLTSDQRSAFVDAVQAHKQDHMSQFKGKGGLKQWAADLQLTDDQKAQIKAAIMQAMAAHKAEDHDDGAVRGAKHPGEAVMAAFKQDTFVFDQVSPPKDVAQHVSRGSERFVGIVEVALPLLTPAQRTLAAQKLRERAANTDADGEMF